MANNNNSGFNVMDMVDDFAAENDMDPKEVFKRHPVSGKVKAEEEAATTEVENATPVEESAAVPEAPKKKAWTPDASLTDGMPELQGSGAVYNKEEVVFERDTQLRNIADDAAVQESREAMDDMSRKLANIEDAKARHGFVKLQIPPGELQTRIMIAAADTNYKRSQEALDALFNEVKETYPEFILETADQEAPAASGVNNVSEFPTVNEDTATTEDTVEPKAFGGSEQANVTQNTPKQQASIAEETSADTKVIIDKRNVSEISWSKEEVEKIKKSRTVELNIVEGSDIEFGSIQDISGNAVDAVLAQYQRKTNDIVAALPASKYRATFTGLTYPEVIDLSSSNEMNTLDGERKKWSICFAHIRNQSIGPWEEYMLYIDPKTGKKVKANIGSDVPDGVEDVDIHIVTKFEDFLRKTSFLDLEFMLWKILCATAMDKEVISIDCHSTFNGKPCGNSYDWIYSPSDLLSVDSIQPAILEEMKQTGEASTTQEIMENYKTSPVCSTDYVKLHTSGFLAVYGHISAFEYLDEIYSKIKDLENAANENDPTIVSRSMAYTTLTTIKAFLLPVDGGYKRITGSENLIKVLDTLDEIDWQTISEITKLMIEPYQFRFSMRDLVCPRCKSRSTISIDSMSRLLFIVARSLSSVEVTLKKR